ncbi:hypothetical protein [Dapis sp. BLCC M172]|uniref:hypothetical protein n=1 Tax=Dapis sp. BLCC M172 TaxID=2975281 RepID=UPI003CECFF1C
MIRSIEYGKSPYVPSEKSRAPFPEALRVRGRRWIERDPPEPRLVADVLESLRRYLGKAGYYWLSACAVFPELHWNLTVDLGNKLKTDDGSSLLQACRLTDIARLPWFRYGYMPDWLRAWLIYDLPRQQEDEVRQLLRNFLVAEPDEQGIVGRWQFPIARQHSDVVSKLAQPLLHLLSKEAPADHPLRDYIFQEFMTGRKRLAVRMPEKLSKQLRRKSSQQVGWGLWFQLVLATAVGLTVTGVVALPVGFAMSNAVTGVVIRIVIFAVIGVVIGAYTGLAQWLLLRKQLFQADWWILATVLGWALGLALFSVVNDAVNNTVSGAVIGSVMGLAQWLVLRTQLFHTGWWIVATILGLTLGFAMNDAFFRVVNDPTSRAIIGAIIGVIYGAITGNALVWLLRQPGNYLLRQRRMEVLNYPKYHRRFERLS